MKTTNVLILEATLKVIVRGGVNAVTFREVAKESGVALGTISYQYPKREELVRSAFAHFLSETTVALRTLVQSMDVRTIEDLARLMTDATRTKLRRSAEDVSRGVRARRLCRPRSGDRGGARGVGPRP